MQNKESKLVVEYRERHGRGYAYTRGAWISTGYIKPNVIAFGICDTDLALCLRQLAGPMYALGQSDTRRFMGVFSPLKVRAGTDIWIPFAHYVGLVRVPTPSVRKYIKHASGLYLQMVFLDDQGTLVKVLPLGLTKILGSQHLLKSCSAIASKAKTDEAIFVWKRQQDDMKKKYSYD